jgi:hypothetical protein
LAVDDKPRSFVVLTDETGQYAAAVDTALERAAAERATVILYDVTASGSAFSDPRPNKWAGEGEQEQYAHPLDPVELEKLGRHGLAVQVQKARARGLDAYGWLPEKDGAGTLAAYAAQQHADLVLAPAGLDELTQELERTPAGVRVERV